VTTGCSSSTDKHAEASKLTLEVRFQDTATALGPAGGLRRRPAGDAPGPATADDVASILVDISYAATGQPFSTDFALTKISPTAWQGDVPLLPRDQQLHFMARALTASGDIAFSGETLATLTADNQDLQIPLAAPQNNQTFQLPRMVRIAYPAEVTAGQTAQIAFTVEGNAGTAIGIQVTSQGSPVASADFSPATGNVVLAGTVADFMAVYTAPQVMGDTDVGYQVTITAASPLTAVAVTTDFKLHVAPAAPGISIVTGTQVDVQLSPVILSMTANGSELPGTVQLVAVVSDGNPAPLVSYQWSYAPAPGTPAVSFANGGQGNPALFQGYTVADQGTITLVVADGQSGPTTLHYQLNPNQFADAIDTSSTSKLKRIAAGGAHTCVITGQDRVHCWGNNQFGQLGYGNTANVGATPDDLPYAAGDVPLPFGDPAVQLVAGNNHTCVLLQSGLMYCWGNNQFGQLGYGRTDNLADNEPVTSFGYVGVGDLAVRIAAGGDHTCAILQNGALRCWGRNDFGQLGHGNTQNLGDDEPVFSTGNVDLGPGATVKDLALGEDHTCALLTTGSVRCWGRNNFGQLGYGNTNNQGDDELVNNVPDVALTGPVRKLAAGNAHTCALTVAGTLRCWGRGDFGQLGQSFSGSNASWGDAAGELPSALPGDIATGAQVDDVVAGAFHTCALSSDGQLKCWGRGDSGQLGYGNLNNLAAPPAAGVDLDGATAFQIAAGTAHTCALRSDGTARCWGDGDDGRLGLGSTASSSTPTGQGNVPVFAPVPRCGDGTLDAGEQCDDGNTANGDGCDSNCTLPACGNGVVDSGEACDDGNLVNGDTCEADCSTPVCGNGVLDPGEQCDDGNLVNGDTCEADCSTPVCGNGILDPGEQCDDGNQVNGDGCDDNCKMPGCGNGELDPGEQCDDGNTANGDGCDSNCTTPGCGNGILDPGEACDDGNLVNGDGCEANCSKPTCGNGIVDPPEQCDDGNSINGDSCDNNCTTPHCGNLICDSNESCSSCPQDCGSCPKPSCGDGVCNGNESCSSCPEDCGSCPHFCGDHVCDGGETCSSCPGDCGACPTCGDHVCNGSETCSSCPGDCCPPSCGDGVCNGSETCSSCPQDCGACPFCGDGVCNGGETCESCADCGLCPGWVCRPGDEQDGCCTLAHGCNRACPTFRDCNDDGQWGGCQDQTPAGDACL
jgi:cysteine-rich repeat protein